MPVAEALNPLISDRAAFPTGRGCFCAQIFTTTRIVINGVVPDESMPCMKPFSKMGPLIQGVMGNHDQLTRPCALAANVHILDGDLRAVGTRSVGGVRGIVGHPHRNQRRTEEDFLATVEKVTRHHPELLLVHQGPRGEEPGRGGNPDLAPSLATKYEGQTVFAIPELSEALVAGQVIIVDGRTFIVLNKRRCGSAPA